MSKWTRRARNERRPQENHLRDLIASVSMCLSRAWAGRSSAYSWLWPSESSVRTDWSVSVHRPVGPVTKYQFCPNLCFMHLISISEKQKLPSLSIPWWTSCISKTLALNLVSHSWFGILENARNVCAWMAHESEHRARIPNFSCWAFNRSNPSTLRRPKDTAVANTAEKLA